MRKITCKKISCLVKYTHRGESKDYKLPKSLGRIPKHIMKTEEFI